MCDNFTKFGKCSYWHTCIFLHVESAPRILNSRICPYHGLNARIKQCRLHHRAGSVAVPKDFLEPHPTSGETELLFQSRLLSVKNEYLAPTLGRFNTLCDDARCNLLHDCLSLHLVSRYWTDETDTPMPKPWYYREAQPSAPRVRTMEPNGQPSSSSSPSSSSQSPSPSSSSSSLPKQTSAAPKVAPADPWGKQAAAERKASSSSNVGTDSQLSTTSSPKTPEDTSEELSRRQLIIEMLTLPPVEPPTRTDYHFDKDLVDIKKHALTDKWRARSKRYRKCYEHWRQFDYGFSVGANQDILVSPAVKLGSGATSVVRLGILTVDGTEVAVKEMKYEDDPDDEEALKYTRAFEEEAKHLQDLAGAPGVVPSYFSLTRREIESGIRVIKRFLVLSLMEASVTQLVGHWVNNGLLGTPKHLFASQYIIGSLLTTVLNLRQPHMACWLSHRDIKPDNLQVDVHHNIQLIDFGISRAIELDAETKAHTMIIGTESYLAPEGREGKDSTTSDLFSVGKVICFLFTGHPGMIDFKIPEFQEHRREALKHLTGALLEKDYHKRAFRSSISSTQLKNELIRTVLAHPFFWTDRRSMNFLATLGNLCKSHGIARGDGVRKRVASDINSAMDAYYKAFQTAKNDTWQSFIPVDVWDAMDVPEDARKTTSLLRFIRNCTHHPENLPQSVLVKPFFLRTFPTLVTHLWEYCLRQTFLYQHPLILPFLNVIFSPTLHQPVDPLPDWL